MPVRMNRMKQKLRQGQPVFGGLLRTPKPTLVEVRGYAGYDYLVLSACPARQIIHPCGRPLIH